MPPFEFKVLRMPFNRQEFYSYFLRSFGWQVQGMQESVDRVETRSFGTTLSTGTGHQNATFWHHPYTNNTTMSGRSYSTGWSSQMGNQVTNVKTSLSVTYQRDLAMPNHDRLAQLEAQCWPFVNAYFGRLDSGLKDDINWREWQSYAYLSKRAQNLIATGTEFPAKATGRFTKLEASHEGNATTFTFSFSVQNRKDMNCLVVVHLTDGEGNSLGDSDACYGDRSGNVAVTSFVKPRYDDSTWDDFKLTIPWDQFHIKKRSETVRYYAALVDISTDSEIVRTTPGQFSYSRSLFGTEEVSELPADPLVTIGNTPQPPKPTPAPGQSSGRSQASVPKPEPEPEPRKATATPPRSPVRRKAPVAADMVAAPMPAELPDAYGEIGKVKIVHNVVDGGRPGMQVQTDLLIRRRNGVKCRYTVFLLDHFGNPLKDVNRQYSTATGDVCASCIFTPDSDEDRIKGLSVFIPYEELDLPDGEYDLRLSATVIDEVKSVPLAANDKVFFFYTQNGDALRGSRARTITELLRAERAAAPTGKDKDQE
jgi:hypothetical protein